MLLKRDVIVTGDQLTNATRDHRPGRARACRCTLDARGGDEMLQDHARQPRQAAWRVVFIEKRRETVAGRTASRSTRDVTDEKVISVATIHGVFGNQFQITGLHDERGARARAAAARRLAGRADLDRHRGARHRPERSARRTSTKGVKALVIGMLGVFVVHDHLLPGVRRWSRTSCCSRTWCC